MNATVTCVSADWDIQQVRCKRNPSCELWDEDMLLRQQERVPEPEPEPEPVIERIGLPPHVIFDHFGFQNIFDDLFNNAPHQRGRNQASFDWMREPGWCSLTVLGSNLTQSKQRWLILCTASLNKLFLP